MKRYEKNQLSLDGRKPKVAAQAAAPAAELVITAPGIVMGWEQQGQLGTRIRPRWE